MTARRMLFGIGTRPLVRLAIPALPLTPGSITAITDDTYYNSWPTACRMGSGSLVALYTKGVQHAGNNNSNPDIKISADDGSTWGTEANIYDHATLKVAASGISVGNSGRLLASLWRDDETSSNTGESGVVYSDDNGATWSGWIALTNGFTGESFAAGPVVKLTNGDLLVTIEGRNSGVSALNRSSHTLRSSDNGATWGGEVTIRNYADDSRPYYETCLLLLDTGELIAIHRTSALTGTHYISRSPDQGLTWLAPYAAFPGYGRPHTIQHSSGGLIAITRKNSDASVVAFTSRDRGASWDAGTVIASGMTEMEYGCPVEKLDGTVLVVFGTQPGAPTTNADIKQLVLT